MPDWKRYVRENLPRLGVNAAREQEIVDELAQQLEQRFADEIARGTGAAEADRRTLAQFADWQKLAADIRRAERPLAEPAMSRVPASVRVALSDDRMRSTKRGNMAADIIQDLRYAGRMLKKSPEFTALIVLTLALGIGANSTIFSVIQAVLLRPLPYPESEQLVSVVDSNPSNGWPRFSSSPANFLDWRRQARSFEFLVATAGDDENVMVGGTPEHWTGVVGTQGFFETLRVRPEIGRLFTDDDFVPGKSNVLVISDALWRGEFGSDAAVIGRAVPLDGKRGTIIGVMPADFHFGGNDKMFWMPFPFDASLSGARGAHFLRVMGRLNSGATIESAQAEMKAIAAQLEEQYPASNAGWTALVERMQTPGVSSVRTVLWVLLAAAGGVLLIACANAANMLLARASVRRREIAVRMAIGASRMRIVRQLLTESVALAGTGGALGLLIAFWSARGLATLPASLLPRAESIHVDAEVLGFTLALAAVTAILFGIAPALSVSRGELEGTLRQEGRGVTGTWTNTRRSLVVVEIALAFVLLFSSGLLMRSLAQLSDVKPGFEMSGRLQFSVSLPAAKYKTPQQQVAFYEQAREKIASLPGIVSASMTSLVPLNGDLSLWTIGINGQANRTSLPSALYYLVDLGYLRAMGIPLLQGRDFTAQDAASSQHVVIINDFFARTLFSGRNPIGQHVQLGRNYDVVREIVGVAATVKQEGLDDKETYQVYEPFAQMPRARMTFIVHRASGDPLGALPAVRGALKQIDPELPMTSPSTLADEIGERLALPRFRTGLLGVFAILALTLALLGLYGVMSYAVSQQTQEIGVRMALGAHARDIYRFVLGRGFLLLAIGVCAGLAGTLGATKVLESFLFDVTAHDPWTIAGVTALFLAVATAACLGPARRATKVDPLVALRYQ